MEDLGAILIDADLAEERLPEYQEVKGGIYAGALHKESSTLRMPFWKWRWMRRTTSVVTLSWPAIQSANGYTVSRSNTQNGTPTETIETAELTLVDDALSDGTTTVQVSGDQSSANGESDAIHH